MRRYILVLFILWLVQPAWAITPAEAATIALQDAKRLPPDIQQNAAYLWDFWANADDKEWAQRFYGVLSFHVNSLSREAELRVPIRIKDGVWRIDLRDYGWQKEVYNKLADLDPYFHVKLENAAVQAAVLQSIQVGSAVQVTKSCNAFSYTNPSQVRGEVDAGTEFKVLDVKGQRALWDSSVGKVWVPLANLRVAGVQVAPNQKKQQVTASAPWLPAEVMTELITLTQNQAPLLRADWFFVQTARQVDRNDQQVVGYYDFLQIKNEKDLEALAGIDRKVIQKRQQEIRAIIKTSTVTINNRQIATIDDGSRAYWESLDVDSNVADKNAIRQLDQDYKQVAKEVYFRLPNGLWGLAAVNAQNGQLAASVPDNIASDGKSTSNDRRVHPGLSCIRCHVEGLRPMDDWARRFYANPPGDAKLYSPDYEKLRRLKQLYLGPLQDRYEDDQRYYARVLLRLTGWTPKDAAKNYAAVWQVYADLDVTGKQLALELGVGYEELLKALKWYVASVQKDSGGNTDAIVIGFLKNPEFTARREHIEEAYVLFQQALQGYKPEEEKDE